MRPPYSQDEIKLICSWLEDGLKALKSTGKMVNYEDMCQRIVDSIPSMYYTPELYSYMSRWKKKFNEETRKRKRDKVFSEFIGDLYNRGLLKDTVVGLTANYSEKIAEIIQKNSTH